MEYKKLILLDFILCLDARKEISVSFTNSPPENLEYVGQAGKIHSWFAWNAVYDSVVNQILIDTANTLHVVARLVR